MNDLNAAYKNSLELANSHYENFPVASFLVPKNLRKHVAVIYKFARTADDFADEGNLTAEERLDLLNEFENDFQNSLNGNPKNLFWKALQNTIAEKRLSAIHFLNLLKAFKQDVIKKHYENFDELLDYCKHSANPVGRLILELYDIRDEKLNEYSDSICTALQLTNFWQDVSIDYIKERIYIPLEHQKKYGISEKDFELKNNSENFRSLIKFEIQLTRNLFNEGKNLIRYLPSLLKYEIIWTVSGGEEILNKIERINYDVLKIRPKLSKFNYVNLLIRSLTKAKP